MSYVPGIGRGGREKGTELSERNRCRMAHGEEGEEKKKELPNFFACLGPKVEGGKGESTKEYPPVHRCFWCGRRRRKGGGGKGRSG